MQSDRRRPGRWLTAVVLGSALLGTTALAGCNSGNQAQAGGGSAAAQVSESSKPAPPTPPASVALQPAGGAQGASPAGPIQAAVTNGTISAVTLTSATGTVVTGQLSADKKTWTASEALGYGKTYTWAGNATGADGRQVPINGSFSTAQPARQISGHLNVGDGQTYGIAMPISLTFSAPVADRATVQKALTVTTSVPTTGSWAWLDNQTVDWRPQNYFAPNTQVSVSAKLYGVAFGNGAYGKADLTSNFTIGRAQVVQANTQTHRMVVISNGTQVADYPASFGLDSDPGRVTHSGTYIVMSKSETYFMSNPKYHYSNVEVHWAVRISNNGTFIHAAPWSVGQQGRVNVSHGCVNLSTANALAYYNTVLPGDPVEITGSSIALSPADGNYYDWALTWAQWQAKSALPTT